MPEISVLLLAAAVFCMTLAAVRVQAPVDLASAAWAFALGWLLVTHL